MQTGSVFWGAPPGWITLSLYAGEIRMVRTRYRQDEYRAKVVNVFEIDWTST